MWRTAMDPGTAGLLREAMCGVVDSGTATRLAVPGFDVGGKTGTAQLGTDPPRSHAWIIGFAGPEGEAPTIAVAVIVEGQPEASSQTGGRVAAPIAQAVLAGLPRSGRRLTRTPGPIRAARGVLTRLRAAMSDHGSHRLQRPLRAAPPHRPGRHGRGVPRARPAARPPVAIKVLFPEFATDPAFVERFRREATAAANLNHPNIVGVYDWGEAEGTYFIVMEYVDGRTLSEILRAEGRSTPTGPPTSAPTWPPPSGSPTATASSTAT